MYLVKSTLFLFELVEMGLLELFDYDVLLTSDINYVLVLLAEFLACERSLPDDHSDLWRFFPLQFHYED